MEPRRFNEYDEWDSAFLDQWYRGEKGPHWHVKPYVEALVAEW